jgi:hypothetical protein
MKIIATKQDLDEALSQERALIFFWVNYAIQARYAEILVRHLLVSWLDEHASCQVSAYRVDISEPNSNGWETVREWLHAEKVTSQVSDSGSLFWVKSGKVALSVKYVLQYDDRKLLAVSESVFAPDLW